MNSNCELQITPHLEGPMLRIFGVTDNITEDVLELFFENYERSGGGDIRNIEMLPQIKSAIITFDDPQGNIYLSQR